VSNGDPHRLPRSVTPERYELELTPDLAAATFAGSARIVVDVNEPTDQVVLNAVELTIDEATCERADGTRLTGTVQLDEASERATISLPSALSAGKGVLQLRFRGVLNDQLAGFYRSTFRDDDGVERVIATTQMEATDARRAFPCWDEPDLKAVFSVRLVVDDGMVAISNGEAIASESRPDGKKVVTFGDTMPMSTYLVAFIVGPLELTEPVDVDGIPLRVAHVPGRGHLTDFALEAAAHSLRFFADYFDIPYPAGKLDLIALPDFAFGAMENLGAVTFRETVLLIDRPNASQAELERVADVVAHEIAHMWFGDLVTMKWWNGIWLNEAFATFMELLAVDAFRPEWERWVSFGTSRAGALNIDATGATRPVEFEVVSPADAEGMFDTLTYQKGASVVRMLEQYLGTDRFRAGIRLYMQRHRYGNTETTDLWDAIEEASGEPVRATMDSWIFQGGFPLVTVEPQSDNGRAVTLSQQRFRFLPDAGGAARWHVPIILRARAGTEVVEQRLLLDGEQASVEFPAEVDWVVANAGGSGFYRTRYDSSRLRRVTAVVSTELTSIERFNLVSDTWAAVLAGLAPVADYVEMIHLFGDETDPDVWSMIVAPLELFERALPPDHRGGLAASVRRLAAPAFERTGWEPAAGEADRTRRLRATLVKCLGGVGGDEAVRARLADLHAAYLTDRSSVEPNLVEPMVEVLAATGGEERYQSFLERFRHPETPQEEVRFLYGLARFRHRGLVQRTLELAISDEVRTQNGAFVVTAALANEEGAEVAWSWVKDHWEELSARFPDNSHARMLGGITMLGRPELAADARSFLTAHPIKAGQRTVEQLLERLDINMAFRQREADNLAELFAEG
jgi:puromycin-sensitive aminopeptidase